MLSLVLVSGFDAPKEEVKKLVTESHATSEPLNIEVPIDGRLYFRDSYDLAGQFLHAAYFGQSIADACSKFECITPSSIAAHESVEFKVIPKNIDEFVKAFWDAAIGYMDDDLLEREGIWDVHAAEAREMGWDYLKKPKLAPHVRSLVEHARQVRAVR
jgi:hypothetical protein